MAIEETEGIATPEELREREAQGLSRELDGAIRRVQELKDANAHADVIGQAEDALEKVRAELRRLGGRKAASTRPRTGGKRETR